MADRDGQLISLLDDQLNGNLLRETGSVVANLGISGTWQAYKVLDIIGNGGAQGGQRKATPRSFTPTSYGGVKVVDIGLDWFEYIHIFPKSIDFGQILTTTTRTVEIANRYRLSNRTLDVFTNPVGGLSITDLPTLPATILRMDSLLLTLQATTEGPPTFDDSLIFETDLYNLLLPVEGLRVTVFPFIPESPINEKIGFLTDILEKIDGGEQRINLRKAPRQIFELQYLLDEEIQRSRFENILFDWQDKVFGVPVWWEPTVLTSDASVSDTVLNVESTAYADYRIGGLVAIISDDVTFDSLELSSLTATTLTLASGLTNAYPAGTKVYPLRTAVVNDLVSGERYAKNLGRYDIQFLIENNNVDLKDSSAYSSYGGKVLLDDSNFMPDDTIQSNFQKRLVEYDGLTGKFRRASRWDKSKRLSQKGFVVNQSRQSLWNVRRLLHFLKGKQVSFYLPTFLKEITILNDLVEAASGMTITNIGYSKHVRQRKPLAIIRITETDGTIHTRTITASSEVSSTVESLTVDTVWPAGGIPVADIAKVDYYELVRMDTDEPTITHLSDVGDARIAFPVKTVFD